MDRTEERAFGEVELREHVVSIRRVTKVVKGGKNFSFSALVVVGDGNGKVGCGLGKAREVPLAISKGIEQAKRQMIRVPLQGHTIPHYVEGQYGAGHVVLRPASKGTGVIAGGAIRAVMEAVGVQDILTKCVGTNNPQNVVKAAMRGSRVCGAQRALRGSAARASRRSWGKPWPQGKRKGTWWSHWSGDRRTEKLRKVTWSMGLRKLHRTKRYPDRPEIRGMMFADEAPGQGHRREVRGPSMFLSEVGPARVPSRNRRA